MILNIKRSNRILAITPFLGNAIIIYNGHNFNVSTAFKKQVSEK